MFDYVHSVENVKNDKRATVMDDDDNNDNNNTKGNDKGRCTSLTTECKLCRSLTMQNMTSKKLHIKIRLQDKNGPFALDEHTSTFTVQGG